uniref:Uncharacterized protein n=1 Tax=Amazona collaria TaxID=241587 RepID=A0A8B9ITE2_9PSIT
METDGAYEPGFVGIRFCQECPYVSPYTASMCSIYHHTFLMRPSICIYISHAPHITPCVSYIPLYILIY